MREGESSLSHHLRRRHRQSPPPLREQSDPRRDPIQFAAAIDREDVDGFSLLDSAEKFITDQKILLDAVTVFNMVSSLSQKEQSVKLTQEGFEVFREYYPMNEQAVLLDCVRETDKFVLHESFSRSEPEREERDIREVPVGASSIQYQSIEVLLGGKRSMELQVYTLWHHVVATKSYALVSFIGCRTFPSINTAMQFERNGHSSLVEYNGAPVGWLTLFSADDEFGKTDPNHTTEGLPHVKVDNASSFEDPVIENDDGKKVEDSSNVEEGFGVAGPPSPSENLCSDIGLLTDLSSSSCSDPLKLKSRSGRKVAFVSVNNPAASTTNLTGFHVKGIKRQRDEREDPFFDLLSGGNPKDSLF
ncbi:hypothetical protein Acr_19g0003760 [Actinidia rufa]|uniref:Uncharacterized protein n=1 Tax=Actinidia rufa TaxID=165716 RepID=A0A7J0G9H8_9ERIC|nr:hypothetical protein Acr_19g0003760 [Actinidia rufa]